MNDEQLDVGVVRLLAEILGTLLKHKAAGGSFTDQQREAICDGVELIAKAMKSPEAIQ